MIRMRLLIVFVLVTLLPVLGVGVGTFIVSYHNGQQQSIDRLESVAARKELAIQGWIKSMHQELLFASQTNNSPYLVRNALRLGNEGRTYRWYNNLVRIRLQSYINQSSQLNELFLIDLQGDVIVSTNPEREGLVYLEQLVFQQSLEQPTTQLPFYQLEQNSPMVYSLPVDRVSVITLAPVNDETGQLMGVMGGRADVSVLNGILDERTGMGSTGQAYLVDSNNALLMAPRWVYYQVMEMGILLLQFTHRESTRL